MPITVQDKPNAVTLSRNSAQSIWVIKGTAVAQDAWDAMIAAAPASLGGLPRVVGSCEVEEVADETWLGTMRYAKDGTGATTPPVTGDSVFSFAVGGGTQRITQSLQTIQKAAPAGQTAPDFNGAIGVTDGGVEGVDIVVPVYHFSETHYKSAASVTDAYRATLYSLYGKVNNATWRNYNAGEVLFMGVTGSKRASGDDWELNFEFAASPNKTGLTVGNITGVNKKGWEYLWVYFGQYIDGTANRLVRRPVAAYVEKVYDLSDFTGLAI